MMRRAFLYFLAISVQAAPIFATGIQERKVSAFACRVALAAVRDVETLFENVASKEEAALASSSNSPLDHYQSLNPKLGDLLESALVGLRFLAAAAVGTKPEIALSDERLHEMATLEQHISNILAAYSDEPIYWWHGPKWLLFSKFNTIFDSAVKQQLSSLANSGGTNENIALVQIVSTDVPKNDMDVMSPDQKVPGLGIVIDDPGCGQLPTCDVSGLVTSLYASVSQPVHVLVDAASPSQVLSSVGAALSRHSGKVFLSILLPPDAINPKQGGTETATERVLNALGQARVDLIWLPLAAAKKKAWKQVSKTVDNLLRSGKIGGYGLQAPGQSVDVTQKLFDRKPAPAAWLVDHDMGRSIVQATLEVAHSLGVSVVSVPRARDRSGNEAEQLVLGNMDSSSSSAAQAAIVRWAHHRGIAALLRPGPNPFQDALDIIKRPSSFDAAANRLLESFAVASGWADVSVEEPALAAQDLHAAIWQGRRKLVASRMDSLRSSQKFTGVSNDFTPRVHKSTLADLETQARNYASNKHVTYKQNFFDDATWKAIVAETKRLWTSPDLDANCNLDGKDRLGGYVLDHRQQNTSLYRMIYGNEQFRQWVSAVNGEGEMWPSDFPIELREYGTKSKGMMCHSDLQMYAVPKQDVEFALTVDNDSGCQVTYYDSQEKEHKVKTTANSLMMVRVNSAVHCVSSTEGGSRSILKFIYVGNYKKSSTFWHYTGNECQENNPNKLMLESRRKPETAPIHSRPSMFEL